MAGVAIVMASMHGQTAAIVARFADALSGRGHTVEIVDVGGAPATPVPEADHVVVASAVYSNEHHKDVQTWLSMHADALMDAGADLISVSLAAALGTDDGEAVCWDYVAELSDRTGWEPARTAFVAGALNESAYDPATRALLKVASWRAGLDASGDVAFTDWAAVDALAERWFG